MPRNRIKVDPELTRQLESAALSPVSLEAVFMLRTSIIRKSSGDEVERLAHEIVSRASLSAGVTVEDMNVFRNLGSFVVSAPVPLIQNLLTAPEIASAVANRRPANESGLIDPVKK